MSPQWPFLTVRGSSTIILKLIWEEAKWIMASTREELYPLHIISSVHPCKTHFKVHLCQKAFLNDHRHNSSRRRPWKLLESVSITPLFFTVLFYDGDNNPVYLIVIDGHKYVYCGSGLMVRLLCAWSLFKLNVSSLRKFSVTYYGLRYKLQFNEYGSLEGDTTCVCVLLNLRYS